MSPHQLHLGRHICWLQAEIEALEAEEQAAEALNDDNDRQACYWERFGLQRALAAARVAYEVAGQVATAGHEAPVKMTARQPGRSPECARCRGLIVNGRCIQCGIQFDVPF